MGLTKIVQNTQIMKVAENSKIRRTDSQPALQKSQLPRRRNSPKCSLAGRCRTPAGASAVLAFFCRRIDSSRWCPLLSGAAATATPLNLIFLCFLIFDFLTYFLEFFIFLVYAISKLCFLSLHQQKNYDILQRCQSIISVIGSKLCRPTTLSIPCSKKHINE